jgi:leucine dehydrogenase
MVRGKRVRVDELPTDGFERVVLGRHAESGLDAVIAVHSRRLGPAVGGARFRPYPDRAGAVADACRLAHGMTYKSALAGNDLGGGKAVIIGDPGKAKTEPLLRAFGRLVDVLGGTYLTAEDVGTTVEDMTVIASETAHVTGLPLSMGGSGDPSAATALGVLAAMRAAAGHVWGSPALGGRHVTVAGVGKVGGALARLLEADGVRLTVADVDGAALDRLLVDVDAQLVEPERAHAVPCDIFSPCALGGVLDEHRIPNLRCRIVAGAANNQLAERGCSSELARRGILYVPDYAANAGGIINIAEERRGYDPCRARERVLAIGETVTRVLVGAARHGGDTLAAADELAEARLAPQAP